VFCRCRKIYEFDVSTLETIGAPFERHISHFTGLALSFDCALLASTSEYDDTIKLWAFESHQLLASFDVHKPHTLILSPNSWQFAYTTSDQSRIHICDIPLDILARIWPEQATCSVCIFTTYPPLEHQLILQTIAPEHSHRTDPLNVYHPDLAVISITHHSPSLTQLVILLPFVRTNRHGSHHLCQ